MGGGGGCVGPCTEGGRGSHHSEHVWQQAMKRIVACINGPFLSVCVCVTCAYIQTYAYYVVCARVCGSRVSIHATCRCMHIYVCGVCMHACVGVGKQAYRCYVFNMQLCSSPPH